MRAMVCARYGPPEGLVLREVERPVPNENEVLVRVVATTVTSGDVVLRKFTGFWRLVFGPVFGLRRNKILGHELSGVVEEVGGKVTRFHVGDPIFASTGSRGGANAEYVCLPEAGMVARKPGGVAFEEAAAVPIGGNTALHFVRKGDLEPGQRALIYGASGSVGTYAVQLARHFGAEVTGVCGPTNMDLVRSLGAGRVIDYTREDFASGGERFDLVFDAVGKLPARRGRSAVKPGGVSLSVRSPTREHRDNLEFLADLLQAGAVKAVIDRRYSLEQISEAHRYVESGHKHGNVVIHVAPERGGR